MHVVHASRKRILGVDVISRSDAQVVGEREILALGKLNSQGLFGVDNPSAPALLEEGHDLPVAIYEVATNAEIKGIIVGLRSAGDCGDRSAEGEVHVSAKKPSPSHIGHMPTQGRYDRNQGIFQRRHLVVVTDGEIIDERDVGRVIPNIETEFRAIPVIDIEIAIA